MSAPSARPPRSIGKRLLLIVTPMLGLWLAGEGLVRLVPGDFRVNRFFYVAGGHEEYYGTRRLFIPYRTLPPYYWTGVPGAGFYNRQGFRGPDFPTNKPDGITRIVAMGCSCTACGQESYPERLGRLLNDALPGRYEVINAGIGSFSTHQGLQVLERHVLPLQPDVVTVYYGWNDRWVHDGRRDAKHRLPTPIETRIWNFLGRSRMCRYLIFKADQAKEARREQRVPPGDYERNLRRFAEIARAHNIRLVYCTTPDGMPESGIRHRFDLRRQPLDWDGQLYELYADRFPDPIAAWNHLQQTYNGIVQSVAASETMELLDLDALVRARRAEFEPELPFFKDGVHFTELGLQELARLYARHLASPGERPALDAYGRSAPYFIDNARRFAAQHQFGAAARYLRDAGDGDPAAAESALREQIASERPFYDLYDSGRIELSNRGDRQKVFDAWSECLRMRPDDQYVRLDLANLAKDMGRPGEALGLTLNFPAFTPENLSRALWIAAECAGQTGQRDLLLQILRHLDRTFPGDPRARQALRSIGA